MSNFYMIISKVLWNLFVWCSVGYHFWNYTWLTFVAFDTFSFTYQPHKRRIKLTSMTCFLLDLSLEAHSTEPPLRSTVNSGLDWPPPNWTEERGNESNEGRWTRRRRLHRRVEGSTMQRLDNRGQDLNWMLGFVFLNNCSTNNYNK